MRYKITPPVAVAIFMKHISDNLGDSRTQPLIEYPEDDFPWDYTVDLGAKTIALVIVRDTTWDRTFPEHMDQNPAAVALVVEGPSDKHPAGRIWKVAPGAEPRRIW